jgi:hypothetical protein
LPKDQDASLWREAATRFTEYRAIRAGRDAWHAIDKAESFAAPVLLDFRNTASA